MSGFRFPSPNQMLAQAMGGGSNSRLTGALMGGLLFGPLGAAVGAYMARGGTTGPGMLSNQGAAWSPGANPAASWRGGYTAPGTSQQGYGNFNDGTQHGPPATMAQAGGTPRPMRTEGAIFNFGQLGQMGPTPGGVNALLRGNTINNGRLLGGGIIPWRQSGIAFGTNPEAL